VHHQVGAGPRIDGREELGRLAALAGASAFAIAQPVLDAFGRSPETFIFRDAAGRDVVTFGFAVTALPPILLWGVGLAVARWAPRWRAFSHGATIGALVGLGVVQVAASIGRPVAVSGAAVAAFGAWVLTVRAEAFRMWSRWLVGLPVVALLAFLVASPSSDLLAASGFEAAAAGGDAPPVVLVVLDELPTASIVDASGQIDERRFPNLARLAGDSTWYRNHTTVNGFTTHAVPSILTGRMPERGSAPLYTDHPDNLFRLLAGSHDLVVSEALTRLCPTQVCGDRPREPGSTDDARPADAQMTTLLHDALDLWLERIGGASDRAGDLAAFEETVHEAPSAAFSDDEPAGSVAAWDEAVGLEPERLTEFLDALEPAERPVAAVLHLVSPHFPWRHLPDGTTYADPATGSDLAINGGNGGVPWVAALERQRHLLQAGYTDALVGRILDHLERTGIYDEAVVVVTADHGIAFQGDENRRLPTEEALPEIMWTPLLVKAPGQGDARVDDSNVQTIDIVPTIADLLAVDLPWVVDGVAAGSREQRARGHHKSFSPLTGSGDLEDADALTVDGRAGLAEMLELAYPAPPAGGDPLAPFHDLSGHGELVGQPFEPDGSIRGSTFEVDDLARLLRDDAMTLVLTGTVAGGEVGADAVAAVADGRIVAVSPVVFRNIGGPAFALLLPVDGSARPDELHLALVRDGQVLDGGPIA
jgi:hypothetical protein